MLSAAVTSPPLRKPVPRPLDPADIPEAFLISAEAVKVQISLAAAQFCLGYSAEAQKFLRLASSRGQTEHVVVLGHLEL